MPEGAGPASAPATSSRPSLGTGAGSGSALVDASARGASPASRSGDVSGPALGPGPSTGELSSEERACIEEIAYESLLAGSYAVAESLYGGLAEACPNESRYLLGHGLSLDRRGRPDEARRVYRRALDRAPREAIALINLAELHLAAAEPALARRYLEALRTRSPPDSAEARKAAALLSLVQRRWPS